MRAVRESRDAGKHLDEADQIKHTSETEHEGVQQWLNVTVRQIVMYIIAFPINNSNNGFRIHVIALQQSHDKSLFPSVTGRAMWHTLHQAAGQPACRLLFQCANHGLPRCYTVFGPPVSATYHLCHCHFPGN